MPRNANTGVYTAPSNAFNPAVPGTPVSSTAWAAQLSDYSTALRHASSTTRALYPQTGQVQDGAFRWGGTAGGTANARTITLSPAITAYATGQTFRFINGAAANTGAVTLSVNGLAAKAVKDYAGTALAGGTLPASAMVEVIYDGTDFRISSVVGNGPFWLETRAITAVAAIDFDLPSSDLSYTFQIRSAILGTAGNLQLRTSTDGGSTFDAGASDYGRSYIIVTGASTVTGGNDSGDAIFLSTAGPTNNVIHGGGTISVGDGAYGARVTGCTTYRIDTGGSVTNSGTFNGNRVATGAVDAIRFMPSSGSFVAGGSITLYGMRG